MRAVFASGVIQQRLSVLFQQVGQALAVKEVVRQFVVFEPNGELFAGGCPRAVRDAARHAGARQKLYKRILHMVQ